MPRHRLLFLTYDIHNAIAGNTLTISGGHGVSRRSATNGADYYLPGYFVAFAAYKMKLQYPVTLRVNVKNLFDKTYLVHCDQQPGQPDWRPTRSAVYGEDGVLM